MNTFLRFICITTLLLAGLPGMAPAFPLNGELLLELGAMTSDTPLPAATGTSPEADQPRQILMLEFSRDLEGREDLELGQIPGIAGTPPGQPGPGGLLLFELSPLSTPEGLGSDPEVTEAFARNYPGVLLLDVNAMPGDLSDEELAALAEQRPGLLVLEVDQEFDPDLDRGAGAAGIDGMVGSLPSGTLVLELASTFEDMTPLTPGTLLLEFDAEQGVEPMSDELAELLARFAASLIGHWFLAEGEGYTAYDFSDFENDGTLTGNVAWTSDGLQFDGGYITVPHDFSLDVDKGLTMAARVYLQAVTGEQNILGKLASDRSSGFLLRVLNGRLCPMIWDSMGAAYVDVWGAVPAQAWTHIAITWESGGDLIGYVDGVEVGRIRASAQPVGDNSAPVIIGVNPLDRISAPVNGLLSDVRLYDVPLPAEAVKLLATWGEDGPEEVDGSDEPVTDDATTDARRDETPGPASEFTLLAFNESDNSVVTDTKLYDMPLSTPEIILLAQQPAPVSGPVTVPKPFSLPEPQQFGTPDYMITAEVINNYVNGLNNETDKNKQNIKDALQPLIGSQFTGSANDEFGLSQALGDKLFAHFASSLVRPFETTGIANPGEKIENYTRIEDFVDIRDDAKRKEFSEKLQAIEGRCGKFSSHACVLDVMKEVLPDDMHTDERARELANRVIIGYSLKEQVRKRDMVFTIVDDEKFKELPAVIQEAAWKLKEQKFDSIEAFEQAVKTECKVAMTEPFQQHARMAQADRRDYGYTLTEGALKEMNKINSEYLQQTIAEETLKEMDTQDLPEEIQEKLRKKFRGRQFGSEEDFGKALTTEIDQILADAADPTKTMVKMAQQQRVLEKAYQKAQVDYYEDQDNNEAWRKYQAVFKAIMSGPINDIEYRIVMEKGNFEHIGKGLQKVKANMAAVTQQAEVKQVDPERELREKRRDIKRKKKKRKRRLNK